MHQETLKEIVGELDRLLPGRFLGKIFQLSPLSLAIDFGLKAEGYLFLSVEPAAPRLYLVKQTVRELDKASTSHSPFAQVIRANLGGGSVVSVTKDRDERIVRLFFSAPNELGDSENRVLVAQLTGRSANLFLLDSAGVINQALRTPKGEGQQIGDQYRPPALQVKTVFEGMRLTRENFSSMSAAAAEHYRRSEAEHDFDGLAANLEAKLRKEISKRKKLKANLKKDLAAHGNPEEHKRLGDLLLANVSNAEREGSKVTLKDYYAEGAPSIELEVDENKSLQEAASESFSRYTKA
ncbi:MAG: NFACT family protein, partial [Acidobacteriota bacterium]|nr:NFACT family protein [Acidobacteriota bacterium]